MEERLLYKVVSRLPSGLLVSALTTGYRQVHYGVGLRSYPAGPLGSDPDIGQWGLFVFDHVITYPAAFITVRHVFDLFLYECRVGEMMRIPGDTTMYPPGTLMTRWVELVGDPVRLGDWI